MNNLSGERPARISLRIPRDLLAAAIEEAEQRGVHFSHLVERALRRELDRPADPLPAKREDPPT
jgi:predicted HicB family RNase H-like nuclease